MWFLSARKTRRGPVSASKRDTFRPRLECLEGRCLLSAGALDTTFGGSLAGSNSPDGTVLGPSGLDTQAVVIYPISDALNHDKIVVGGELRHTVITKHGTTTTTDFGLVRYNANGSLDTSFGTQGTVSTAIGTYIVGLALQSDGKIVAVGPASSDNSVVARYTSDGHLDPTFGTNGSGFILTHLVVPGASTNVQSPAVVAIQGTGSNEKIYVGGWAGFTKGNGKNATKGSAFTVVCYTANGNLDTTFGSGGIAVAPNFAWQSNAFALAIQPSDGKILLAGNAYPSAMAVVRYTTAGVLDSTFGPSTSPGVVTLTPPNSAGSDQAGAKGILVQPSGAIVLSGYGYYPSAEKQVLARLSPAGTPDTTFGNSAFVINPYILTGHNIVQAANGDLLTVGSVGSKTYDASDDFGVAAYLPNGAPDTTFGSSLTPGTSIVDITSGEDMGRLLAIQSDGRIVVGGFSYDFTTSTFSVALARFLPPATKITSFTPTPNPASAGSSVTLTASGITGNPAVTSIQVFFYLETSGNGILEPLTDASLGSGTATLNSNGTWTINLTTAGLAGLMTGTYTLYTQAQDSYGVFSDPVVISFQVI